MPISTLESRVAHLEAQIQSLLRYHDEDSTEIRTDLSNLLVKLMGIESRFSRRFLEMESRLANIEKAVLDLTDRITSLKDATSQTHAFLEEVLKRLPPASS